VIGRWWRMVSACFLLLLHTQKSHIL
jgi:hypothetical protein